MLFIGIELVLQTFTRFFRNQLNFCTISITTSLFLFYLLVCSAPTSLCFHQIACTRSHGNQITACNFTFHWATNLLRTSQMTAQPQTPQRKRMLCENIFPRCPKQLQIREIWQQIARKSEHNKTEKVNWRKRRAQLKPIYSR